MWTYPIHFYQQLQLIHPFEYLNYPHAGPEIVRNHDHKRGQYFGQLPDLSSYPPCVIVYYLYSIP